MKEEKLQETSFAFISKDENKNLKKRIFASIYSHRSRRHRVKYSMSITAGVAIIVLICTYIYKIETSPIDDYVKIIKSINNDDINEVKLILNNNQNILIAEKNAIIKYSNTGEKIKMGTSKEANQSVLEGKKIVYNTVIVPFGKRSQVELSDGSMVWLNSGSKFVYPAVFKKDKREVYLEGEGIFEVRHDRNHPFIVIAKNHRIDVLGTVFNVSSYSDDDFISTTLKNGSVQISYKGSSFFNSDKTMKIIPGTSATYNKSTNDMKVQNVEVDKYFSWREGAFIFKNDNLKSIAKRISRYYNVDITIKNRELESETFSGYLDLKDDVEKVILTIKETTNFTYDSTEKNKIIIN
jgi:hypothetical protein